MTEQVLQFCGQHSLASLDHAATVVVCPHSADLSEHILAFSTPAAARSGRLIVLDRPEPRLHAVLLATFHTVVAPPVRFLPEGELLVALAAPHRTDLCIGGLVEPLSGVVVLYRGDLSHFTVPLASFRPTADGVVPEFAEFAVIDFGQTLQFGAYEASFDAVLYENDPDYRRRLKSQRLASDESFGASLRRLRNQRGLTRKDFPGVDARTIARIETGVVVRPHRDTLAVLAHTLGVSPDEIEQF